MLHFSSVGCKVLWMVTDILELPFATVLYCEDIDIRFLWNIDDRKYTHCYNPEDCIVNLQCSKNLKSFIVCFIAGFCWNHYVKNTGHYHTCGASCPTCCHNGWNRLLSEQAQEFGYVLHISSKDQCLWKLENKINLNKGLD